MFIVFKYLTTSAIIVLVSEIAKKYERMGALIASLPLVTILVMIWLHVETGDTEKISKHASFSFWYVLPTLPMFLLIPYLIKKEMNFWLVLTLGSLLTVSCFGLLMLISNKFKLGL